VALASASPEETGWDDSIQRVEVDKKIQYRIKVADIWYQTVRLIADFRANHIVGRATRVWEVKKMEQDGERFFVPDAAPSYALKDLWINRSEHQEALIIKRLRFLLSKWREANPNAPDAADYTSLTPDADIDFEVRKKLSDALADSPLFAPDADPGLPEPWGEASYDRYFPNVLVHGYVKLSDRSQDCSDHQMRPGRFAAMDVNGLMIFDPDPPQRISKLLSERSFRAPDEPKTVSKSFRNTIHYRIVIQHIGERLDDVGNLGEVLSGLKDAAIGT
jgi:hypothetical protein